jgi:HEAT repeat protein
VGDFTASQLLAKLRTEKDPNVRRGALIGLELIGPRYRRGPLAVVATLKEDSEETVREAAAQVLGKMAQAAHDIREKELRDSAVETRDLALGALRTALKEDRSPRVRQAAALALGRVGAEDRRPEASLQAARKQAVPVLIAALKDEASGPRAAAAESLGRLGPLAAEALAPLVEAFKNRQADRFVRSYIAFAIGRIGGDEARSAVPILAEALTDSATPPEVRRSAAEALGALKGEAAGAAASLGQALKDRSVAVRRAAVAALDQLGPEARPALASLKEAARDDDKLVRALTLHVLGSIPQEAAAVLPVLLAGMRDQLLEVRLAAIEALGRLGPEAKAAVPALTAATRDSQTTIREAAAEALKKIQSGS